MARFPRLSLATFTLLLAAGCGGGSSDAPTAFPVSGKLTKGSEPLANVTINFVPVGNSGLPSSGTTDASGTYTLKRHTGEMGAIPGSYKVTLVTMISPEAYSKAGASGPPQASSLPFPKEYTSADTSPKTVEVKAEPNTIDIDVGGG